MRKNKLKIEPDGKILLNDIELEWVYGLDIVRIQALDDMEVAIRIAADEFNASYKSFPNREKSSRRSRARKELCRRQVRNQVRPAPTRYNGSLDRHAKGDKMGGK